MSSARRDEDIGRGVLFAMFAAVAGGLWSVLFNRAAREVSPLRGPIVAALLLAVSAPATVEGQRAEPEHRQELFLTHELSFVLAGTYETRAAGASSKSSAPGHGESTHHNFTVGAEYELRFHRIFGVGAAVEYITHEKNWLFVFPAYFHVYRGLKLITGPGFERKHEHADTEVVLRIGAMYSFEFAHRYSVTPAIALDLIGRDNAIVYGLNFGVAF